MAGLTRSRQSQRVDGGYLLFVVLLIIIAMLLVDRFLLTIGDFPAEWNLHVREPIDSFKDWVIGNRNHHPVFAYFFDPVSDGIDFSLRRLESVLLWLPWYFLVVALFLVALKAGGLRLALLSALCLVYMGMVGLWDESVQTLALMGVAVAISLIIGVPLGVVAARNDRFEAVMRPLLDGMQTMPAFVYLIPVLLFFGVARVPAVVATVIYAIPPAIKLTNLGIRQVSPEAIEAARSFGSTPRQLLLKVQIPLAVPSILAGVNQTIMMALGIVVIAALIGAGGLGRAVLIALQRLDVGKGMEAGLAIVFMAVLLDRISYAFTELDYENPAKRWRRFHLLPDSMAHLPAARRIEAVLARLFQAGERFSQFVSRQMAWLHLRARRRHQPERDTSTLTFFERHTYLATSLFVLLLLLLTGIFVGPLREFPAEWRMPLRDPVNAAVDWMRDNLYQIGELPLGTGPLSDFITIYFLDRLRSLLTEWLPWTSIVVIASGVALAVSGWRLAIMALVGTLLIGLLGMWNLGMDTLSQVIVAVVLSILIAIPLGVLSARYDAIEALLRPVLDTLQTIPPFVYLVPVIMLFNIGRVPGIMASILYALPPGIRLTSLGIRRVQAEVVEASRAFGSTSLQTLVKVQLPLALPSILMGINQTIMMVLSMVIIAGLVGGGGLGLEAVIGLARNETGRGIEAGLAIVIMAIIMDRVTQGWAMKRRRAANIG